MNRERRLILVIDDDYDSRRFLKHVLEQEGYDVEIAENGTNGVELFKRILPDLLILDVMMPGMNGFEVCKKIREMDEDINTPILMLTGLDDVESIEESFNCGATDFIIKPVNKPIFKQRICYILKAREMVLELYKNQARLAHAHNVARFGHWDWDIVNDHFYWSDEIYNIFSLDKTRSGNSYKDYLKYIHPDDVASVKLAVTEALEKGTTFNIDHRVKQSDGKTLVVHEHAEVIQDASGKAIRMLGVIQDITERHITQQTIRHQAYYDGLTDLPNRNLFRDRLLHALDMRARKNELVAVFYIDFDRFKNINDTLGHASGDEFLVSASSRLSKSVRASDTVARLGGDEFAIIVEGMTCRDDVDQIAIKLINELSKPHKLGGKKIVSTASVGITISPVDGSAIDELLKQADLAMYRAKERGGNQYCFFTDNMWDRSNRSLILENELRMALENNELRVYYQPKIDVASGTINGMEALLRWEHPEKGMIPPLEFIPLAEETGLIIRIGQWVLEESCRQTIKWHNKGFKDLVVSVNISPMQFNQEDFIGAISTSLNKAGLEARYLELEITESCTMMNVDEIILTLHKLREMGMRISIDDFGTGYSSLSYLNKMPLDTLKVDRAFIKDINLAGENGELAKLIIAMAKSLGLYVVSEGIETEAHLTFLQKHGSDEYQGYLGSPPVSADEFEALLSKYLNKGSETNFPKIATGT